MSVPNVGATHYRDGGTRGGRDQFNWDDVKTETYREHYIGHSLKAPIGQHYKNKDHLWWTKGRDPNPLAKAKPEKKKKSKKKKKHKKKKRSRSESSSSDDQVDKRKVDLREKAILKAHEEEQMAVALGLSERKEQSQTRALDSTDMRTLLARGHEDMERTDTDGERIKGLGAGYVKKHDQVDSQYRKRGGEASFFIPGSNEKESSVNSKFSEKEKEESEAERKERKRAKKEKKKHKKKHKRRRHDSEDEEDRLHQLLKQNKTKLF